MLSKELKFCNNCLTEKKLSDFYRSKKGLIFTYCKKCCILKNKESSKKHNEALRARRRAWYHKNKIRIKLLQQEWIKNNPHYKSRFNSDSYRKKSRERHAKIREKILNAFGHICACCGESKKEFLALDHINGDGGDHRKMKRTNIAIYRDVIRLGFPRDRFRLLCHNCNHSIGSYGYCPHGNLTNSCICDS